MAMEQVPDIGDEGLFTGTKIDSEEEALASGGVVEPAAPAADLLGAMYTLEMWRVIPGQEAAFIAAWQDLGNVLGQLPQPPAGKGIVAQKLLKSIKPGVGRVPAVEIMFFGPMVQKLILEGEDHKLPDAIRIGADEGMQDFTMSLKKLVAEELIDRNTAFSVAPNQDALKMALKGIDVRAAGIL